MSKIIRNLIIGYLLFVPNISFAVPVDVNFESVPLGEVVKFVTTYKKVSIIYSETNLPITWHQNGIRDEVLIENFNYILNEHGLYLVNSERGYYKITSKNTSSLTSKSSLVYHLKFFNADDVIESLQNSYGDAVIVESVKDSPVVFITASPAILKHIQRTLYEIDNVQPNLKIYKIKHAAVKELANIINELNIYEKPCVKDFWNKQILCQGSPLAHLNSSMLIYRMDVKNTVEQERVVNLSRINADNALMVINSKDYHLNIIKLSDNTIYLSGVMADLDKAVSSLQLIDGQNVQIQIEAVIASLTDTAFKDFGLKLTQTGHNGTGSIGANAFQAANQFTPTMLIDFLYKETGLNMNASQGTYNGEIISSPFLTVLNGQEGFIHVGQNIPFITSSTENNSGSITTSVTRQDIGVKLSIKPDINGDNIKLAIDQEISTVTPDGQGSADVVTEVQRIKSTVLLSDGETIFLGGVKSSVTVDQESQVPLLGDIPYLGSVFRYVNEENENRNLVISIRPKILTKVGI